MLGDTLLTAVLTCGELLRGSDFSAEPRAGFCLMGACQDCWVKLGDGRRVRACATLLEAGQQIRRAVASLMNRALWERAARDAV
jgi:aerobic-type carbon monoxide dehydrogenase small subunit (CoxS/CutS family)